MKINSGIFKIWASRTKDDLTWLNIIMLVYLTLKSGFELKWWYVVLFIVFLIARTVWDHSKVMNQQIDFWLSQSKTMNDLTKKIDEIHGRK